VSRNRRALVFAAVLLLAAVAGIVYLTRGDDPVRGLSVTWGGSEAHPCCVYDRAAGTVRATIAIDGSVRRSERVTVTVTAYADENTSDAVGSGTRTVAVDGTVHRNVVVTIPVTRSPHLDDDGIVACRLAVRRSRPG
jgi:hypothetical protein